jgi:hypothetical protein
MILGKLAGLSNLSIGSIPRPLFSNQNRFQSQLWLGLVSVNGSLNEFGDLIE